MKIIYVMVFINGFVIGWTFLTWVRTTIKRRG